MTRLFIFLLAVTIISIVAMWFIENDGSIIMEWMGYRVQTSVAFISVVSVILIVISAIFLQFLLWLKRYPENLKKSIAEKKKENGLTALTEGFAAVAAGDAKQAKLLNKKAISCLGPIPIIKLLSAQTAQLDGNKKLAKEHYESMLENKETEMIAIKGLLIQAREDGNLDKAKFLAEKAMQIKPDADWAVAILIDIYKMLKEWDKAEEIINLAAKRKIISEQETKQNISVIYLARSLDKYKNNDVGKALSEIKQAYKLNSDFIPIISLYSKLLLESGNKRKVIKIIEESWKNIPHPDIAQIYSSIFLRENNEKRISRAEKLLELQPDHPESHLAVAKVAIDTGTLSKARNHLKIAIGMRETASVCHLMAELERRESASPEIVQSWMERAEIANDDNSWVCSKCNYSTDSWNTNCKNCNSFNSYFWGSKSNLDVVAPDKELITNSA